MRPGVNRRNPVTRGFPARTVQTFGNGRIQGQPRGRNRLAAIGAKAILPLVDPLQGGADLLPLCLPPPGLRLRHRLVLQRVHASEPASGLLIKRDGFLGVGGGSVLGVEGCEAGLEGVFCVFHLGFINHDLLQFDHVKLHPAPALRRLCISDHDACGSTLAGFGGTD